MSRRMLGEHLNFKVIFKEREMWRKKQKEHWSDLLLFEHDFAASDKTVQNLKFRLNVDSQIELDQIIIGVWFKQHSLG